MKLRLLLIEDNDVDREKVERILSPDFEVQGAQSLGDGLRRLACDDSFDCALIDLGLPDSQGLATLEQARAEAPEVPMIVLTGIEDKALGMEAVKLGAQDYLPKSRLDSYLLERSIQYSIERQNNVRQERALEEKLQRAMRLKAVGRLAGGIAHDFNNLLTVVVSMTAMTLDAEPLSDDARADLEQAMAAAERATELTRQLLTFSRRGQEKEEVVDVNRTVLDLDPMLRRLLTGRGVELVVLVGDEPFPVLISPSRLEQVLVNLVVNARHAMADSGTLTIETGKVVVDGVPHAQIAVSDTGIGMEPTVVDQLFEPFFTTRDDGTGLGLATVYGIVDGAGGDIEVVSTPGAGSTFEILLPIADAVPDVAEPRKIDRVTPVRSDTELSVLLVEDQPLLRAAVVRILQKAQIAVVAAPSAEEGLDRLRGAKFNLVISDVFLPGISGVEFAERIREEYSSMPILLTSGYVAEHIARIPTDDPLTQFLPKPFRPAELLERVEELLARDRPPRRDPGQ